MAVENKLCRRCGETANDHDEKTCSKVMKCVKCGGEHMATSRACDHWRKEKEIVTVKHRESLSFPEARKVVENRYRLSSSNSTVVKANKKVELKDAN